MKKRRRFKSNAERRDLMNVGKRVPLDVALGEVPVDEVEGSVTDPEYVVCSNCYREACDGCRNQRYPRYSPDDYAPYQQTEDDLIACIDLLRDVGDEAVLEALTVEYLSPLVKGRVKKP